MFYFAVIALVQPKSRLGDPVNAKWIHHTLWDDNDWAAVAIRTLNSERGRLPGKLTDPCYEPRENREPLSSSNSASYPLKPRYFLEYPELMVQTFRNAFLFVPDMRHLAIRPAVLDGCQWEFGDYTPDKSRDGNLWQEMRQLINVYRVEMLLCLLTLIAILRRGYIADRSLAAPELLLILPGLLYFSLNRFDVIPSLLTALSLFCLGRNKTSASAAFLALGGMVKVYPLFLAPLFLRYVGKNRRSAILWLVVFGSVIVVVLGTSVASVGWAGMLAPFRYQLSRGLEAHTIYGAIVPHFFGRKRAAPIRLLVLLLTIAATSWKPIRDLPSLLRRSAIVLTVFISIQVFFSPQWVLWLAPLLAPLAGSRRWLIPCFVALDAAMYVGLVILNSPLEWFDGPDLYLRVGVSAILVALLVKWEWFSKTDEPVALASAAAAG